MIDLKGVEATVSKKEPQLNGDFAYTARWELTMLKDKAALAYAKDVAVAQHNGRGVHLTVVNCDGVGL